MDEETTQEEIREEKKVPRIAKVGCLTLLAALIAVAAIVIFLIPRGPLVFLSASNEGHPVPDTPVVIEVVQEGAIASFRGSRTEGLQWPIYYHGGWDWLKASSYWESCFQPDMAKRALKGLYGTEVPILLTLGRNVEFAVPPPDVFTNIWVRVERSDSTLLAGLSFCITDPNDEIEEDRGRLFVFWQGKRFEVPFEHGCLPVTILADGRYAVRSDIRAIWLPRTGMTDERCRVPLVNMSELSPAPYSETGLTNLVDSAGKGLLLCVDVEQGATVQQIVDFMSLCRKLDQPWTFYYYAASFE